MHVEKKRERDWDPHEELPSARSKIEEDEDEILDHSSNSINFKFYAVPLEIDNLSFLTKLDLSMSEIAAIPTKITELQFLETFIIDDNQIRDVPEKLANMPRLRELSLLKNPIETIPTAIWKAHRENKFRLWASIPEQLGQKTWDFDNSQGDVPNETWNTIFRFLTPSDLTNVSLVCKQWYLLANSDYLWRSLHLKALFPKAQFIDEGFWGSNDVSHPYVRSRVEYLRLSQLASRVNGGMTILTIPGGFSLGDLKEIVKGAIGSDVKKVRVLCRALRQILKNLKSGAATTVALTNSIFERTKAQTMSQQKAFLERLGVQMPRVMTVATAAIIRSFCRDQIGPHPYKDNFTYCAEEISHQESEPFHPVFANYLEDGITVSCDDQEPQKTGVGAEWTFFGVKSVELSL